MRAKQFGRVAVAALAVTAFAAACGDDDEESPTDDTSTGDTGSDVTTMDSNMVMTTVPTS